MFQGKVPTNIGHYYLGKLACDFRIAKELQDSKYRVRNPCKTIKTYHLHLSNVRHYTHADGIPGKGSLVKPTF